MAKQHPDKGGYWYASMAGSYCSEVHLYQQGAPEIGLQPETQIIIKPGSDPEVNQRRQKILDELTIKCQGVTKDDFVSPTKLVEARGQKDIAWAAYLIENDFEKKAKAILALKDPLLIYDAGHALTMNHSIDGSYYEGALVPLRIISNAWSLLPCELGISCGLDNPYVKLQCATRGECYNDLPNLVFNYNAESFVSADREKIIALSKSMAENIRNKNVEAFLPPRKK
jgi:hypothetical protein